MSNSKSKAGYQSHSQKNNTNVKEKNRVPKSSQKQNTKHQIKTEQQSQS